MLNPDRRCRSLLEQSQFSEPTNFDEIDNDDDDAGRGRTPFLWLAPLFVRGRPSDPVIRDWSEFPAYLARRQHQPHNNALPVCLSCIFISRQREKRREEPSLLPLVFAIGPQNALVPGYSCVLTVNTLPLSLSLSLSPSKGEKWPRQKEPSSIHAFLPCSLPPASPAH